MMLIGQPKKFNLFVRNEANPIEHCKREATFWADAMCVLGSASVKDTSTGKYVLMAESGIWNMTDFEYNRILWEAFKLTPNNSIKYTEVVDVKKLFLASQNIWYRHTFFPHQTSFEQFTKDDQFKNDDQFTNISIKRNYLTQAFEKFNMPGSEYKFDSGDDNHEQRKAKLFVEFEKQFEAFFYSDEEKNQRSMESKRMEQDDFFQHQLEAMKQDNIPKYQIAHDLVWSINNILVPNVLVMFDTSSIEYKLVRKIFSHWNEFDELSNFDPYKIQTEIQPPPQIPMPAPEQNDDQLQEPTMAVEQENDSDGE